MLSRQTFCNPIIAGHQTSLSFTISWNLLKLKSIELVMPSNHFTLCPSHLLLPSILPSIRIFSKAEGNQQNAKRFPEVNRRSTGVRLQSIRRERDKRERTRGRYSVPFVYPAAYRSRVYEDGGGKKQKKQNPVNYKLALAIGICQWQPTPVFLPGKSHGRRSLVGYSLWGRKESDRTEHLHFYKD